MILLTGGSGRLGRELRKLNPEWFAPTREEFDIDYDSWHRGYPSLIVHAAATTDINLCQNSIFSCWKTNVDATKRLWMMFPGVPFVYINSEYAFNPTNVYALSKYTVGSIVRGANRPSFDLYPCHFERPWRYDTAFKDMWTMGDYADMMAPMVSDAINDWDRKTKRAVHLGTGRKTGYELAQQSRPSVVGISLKNWGGVPLPADYRGSIRDGIIGDAA